MTDQLKKGLAGLLLVFEGMITSDTRPHDRKTRWAKVLHKKKIKLTKHNSNDRERKIKIRQLIAIR